MRENSYRVSVMEHRDTGVFMAFSPDLKGLMVHGKSAEDVESRLPGVVKDLLRAAGHNVTAVELVREAISNLGYGPPSYIANAHLQPQP